MTGSSFGFATRSTLLSASMAGVVTSFSSVSRNRSPGPGFTEVSTTRQSTSTSHRLERDVHHPHVHPVRRLVDARRVDEDDLSLLVILHADDARAGRLRLVRDDGELVADNAIEE